MEPNWNTLGLVEGTCTGCRGGNLDDKVGVVAVIGLGEDLDDVDNSTTEGPLYFVVRNS